MSEYWVSKKRYYCKYCEIYIADDVPSKQQHEGGLRHKGNKERFVRGLYKASEKKKHDLEEETREMARVERAAQAAFAQDVGAGHAKAGSSSTQTVAPKPAAAPAKPAKPTSKWANYSTAESLGFADLDAERLAAEAELRRTQGVVGDWEVLAAPFPGSFTAPAEAPAPAEDAVPAEAGRKREAEAEAPVDEDDTRLFKLRKKAWSAGLGEIWDPDAVPIKLKAKAVPPPTLAEGQAAGGAVASASVATGAPIASERPQWTSKGWNKPGELVSSTAASGAQVKSDFDEEGGGGPPTLGEVVKSEDGDPQTKSPPPLAPTLSPAPKTEEPAIKLEESVAAHDPTPAEGSIFRKRKIPAGSAGTRGRRQI